MNAIHKLVTIANKPNIFRFVTASLKSSMQHAARSKKIAAGVNQGLLKTFRPISTTPVMNQPPSLVKMRRLQAEFQCDDGKPVWLKGGMKDRVLATITFILCAIALLNIVLVIYSHARPTSWKQADKC